MICEYKFIEFRLSKGRTSLQKPEYLCIDLHVTH